jgi:hypothetical protein
MVERSVYVGSILQLIVRLAHGEAIQVWIQNRGDGEDYPQGTAITAHLPVQALRVLPVSTSVPVDEPEPVA